MSRDFWTRSRSARRAVVAVVGISVLLIGVVVFFTPAPSTVVFAVGLGILATEFVWAGRLLRKVKETVPGLRGQPAPPGPALSDRPRTSTAECDPPASAG